MNKIEVRLVSASLVLTVTSAVAADAQIQRELLRLERQNAKTLERIEQRQIEEQGIGIIGIHGAPIGTDNPRYAPVPQMPPVRDELGYDRKGGR